ncbi:MAG: TlpA family protein disulfide reductase [Planctomycetes bacterium]|nr:TlpA family protein disulfide reductase [Planctomycetota bacterium]
MCTTLASFTFLAALAAAWDAGTLATYEGEMVAERADDNVGAKTFTLNVFVAGSDADTTTFLWTLQEKGRGAFPWPARFGQWRVTGDGRTIRGAAPAVLFDHGEGLGEASLAMLFGQPPDSVSEGDSWHQSNLEFTVADQGEIVDRDAWRVQVRSPYGPKGEVWLSKDDGSVVALTERLTLGRGKPYTMKLKINDSQLLSQEQHEKIAAAFESWRDLRNSLEWKDGSREIAWTVEQLDVLKEQLHAAAAKAEGTPLAGIAAEAQEDFELQSGRSGRVAAMRTRLLDRPAPHFELETIGGETVSTKDLEGNVVVLHFWEYRDAPLEEPYGQVGYLDFLFRRHKDAGVKVYGVAVDERLAGAGTRAQAIASARKLQSFMNLSYPLLLDDGAVLKRFGDPRTAGGKLPLFVMLGPDGKVLHYHAGYHEIDRDVGLKELDQAVSKALQK